MKPYLNEVQLAFLVNLSQCAFYDAWDLTNPYGPCLIKECPDFVSNAYIEFQFDIQNIQYDLQSEDEDDGVDLKQVELDNKKYSKIHKAMVKNWKAKNPLFAGLDLKQQDLKHLDDCIQITARRATSSKKVISQFLNDYLESYEKGSLYQNDKNTVYPSYHLKKFVTVLAYFSERYGKNRVKVDIKMGFSPKTGLDWDSGLDSKPIELPHENEYRFTEFFLLMEKKGYIELLELVSSERYLFPYEYVVNILRDPKEILSLEENWFSYGTLSFQPESGHVFNGDVKPRLAKNSAPFKLIELLIQTPEKKYSLDELELVIFQGDETSVSKEQSKTRIQDAAKRVREALKMNAVDSSVNVFSKDGLYWLGTVPSRK